MRGEHPFWLSPDAARVLEWARELDTVRDSFSNEARPEQIERVSLGNNRWRHPWFGPRQICQRHVIENLRMSSERAEAALRELYRGGLLRSVGYFRYEVADAVDVIFAERKITREGLYVA